MPLTYFKVGLVIGGRDLEHSGAKLYVNMLVGNDGQMSLILHRQRSNSMLADEVPVARVPWIHRDAAVARDRLRPRGGDLQPSIRLLDDLHLEIIELAVLLFHDDFLV